MHQHLAARRLAFHALDQGDEAGDVHPLRLDIGPAGIQAQRTAQIPARLEGCAIGLHAPQPPDMGQHFLQRRKEQGRRRMEVGRLKI
ncbi:hypothetical protein D3C87_1817620 [compost metagenome]